MAFDVGDLWTPQLTVKNAAGALTAATVVCTVTSPSGVVTTPAVSSPSIGVYTATVVLTAETATPPPAATWTATWTVSGAVTGVEKQEIQVLSAPFTGHAGVIKGRWRPTTAEGIADAESMLVDAAVELHARVPNIIARYAAGSLAALLVRRVQAAMVERVLSNPDGKRQESKSIDDYTHSWTVDSALSAGALYVTEDELALLSSKHLTVGTIRLGIGL